MTDFLLSAAEGVLGGIGIAVWLGIASYAISKGWHKAKTEYPTTINTYHHDKKN